MTHHDHTLGAHRDAEHLADLFSQDTWDARYAESDRIWSGNPNQRLVEQVAGLTPGSALDVGAGEGADAVWLARQGWQVTALDVSEVALAKATAHAEENGVGGQVTALHLDLINGPRTLPDGFDLVSAQFMHPPADQLAEVFGRLGRAVRPGGHLLVVGHHPHDLTTGMRTGHGHPELLYTPEQLVAVLPGDEFEILVADTPSREVTRDGETAMITDSVVLAVRR
ncbi:MAG TPA: class I SAM-dependent methyltransferase [Marmoricola sp.]|nr:class I SAM-dependent methyltransferase [Marmoricola sp.]